MVLFSTREPRGLPRGLTTRSGCRKRVDEYKTLTTYTPPVPRVVQSQEMHRPSRGDQTAKRLLRPGSCVQGARCFDIRWTGRVRCLPRPGRPESASTRSPAREGRGNVPRERERRTRGGWRWRDCGAADYRAKPDGPGGEGVSGGGLLRIRPSRRDHVM
jgi:hypothetical protein